MEGVGGGGGGNRPRIPFPLEVFQYILKLLGPLDLNACRNVSRAWSEEVKLRAKALRKFTVSSMDDVEMGMDLLKGGPELPPPYIIQELKICILSTVDDEYHKSDLFKEFIRSLSGISLGKVFIEDQNDHLLMNEPQNRIRDILEWNPNLFHLELDPHARAPIDPSASAIFQYPAEVGERHRENYFPSLRTLKLGIKRCSLYTILRACPNLRHLALGRLEAPFLTDHLDGSKLKNISLNYLDWWTILQLINLNLKLTNFSGSFTIDSSGSGGLDICSRTVMKYHLSLFKDFLEGQGPTLQELYLSHQGTDIVLGNRSELFPCPLPHLTKLTINLRLVSDFNEILESAPRLEDLALPSHWNSHRNDKGVDYCLPTRVINDHLGIKKLRVQYIVQPHQLAQFGISFQNLTKLVLMEAIHGILPTVYTELTRLTVLDISESDSQNDGYEPLHDTDFTGTHYPITPYIGTMKNLKKFSITFSGKPDQFESDEDSESDDESVGSNEDDSMPLITDAIFTRGILDIVTQLDKLVILGVEISTEVLEKMGSFMQLKKHNSDVTECYKFVKLQDERQG